MIRDPQKYLKKLLSVGMGAGVILVGLLIISSKFELVDKTVSQRNLLMPVAMLILITGLTLLKYATKIKDFNKYGLLFAICCLLLTVFDLFRFGWKFTPFSPREYLYPITPAIKFLQENMQPRDRYMTLDRRILPPNANIMYGIKTIEGYDPIYFKEYAKTISEMEGGVAGQDRSFGRIIRPINYRSEAIKFLSVKYVLSLNDMSDEFLEKVFQEGETRIYELENNI